MAFANVWIGVRVEAHDLIVERLRWDEEAQGPYTGPVTDDEHMLFRYMADQPNTQRLFKKSKIAGKDWTLWSINFTEKLPQVKIRLDQLLLDRPNHISLAGAWQWDGAQHGTEHVYSTRIVTKTWSILNPDYQPDPELPDFDDRYVIQITGEVEEEYISGFTGTPLYPIPLNALLKFMPDDENGDPAVALADVNLLMGQSPRWFA